MRHATLAALAAWLLLLAPTPAAEPPAPDPPEPPPITITGPDRLSTGLLGQYRLEGVTLADVDPKNPRVIFRVIPPPATAAGVVGWDGTAQVWIQHDRPGDFCLLIATTRRGRLELLDFPITIGTPTPAPPDDDDEEEDPENPFDPGLWRAKASVTRIRRAEPLARDHATAIATAWGALAASARSGAVANLGELWQAVADPTDKPEGLVGKYAVYRAAVAELLDHNMARKPVGKPIDGPAVGGMLEAIAWATWEAGRQ